MRAATWRARRDRLPHGIAVDVVITFLVPGAWTTSAGCPSKLGDTVATFLLGLPSAPEA
jgi:hypothetical protein